MAQTIAIVLDDGSEIQAQVSEPSYSSGCGGLKDVIKKITQKSFDDTMKKIGQLLHSSAKSISESNDTNNIESITLTTGVNLSADGNLLIVNGTAEISFEVSVTYKQGD